MDWNALYPIVVTTGIVICVAIVFALLTQLDRRKKSALIRLDWFLPALRRIRNGESPAQVYVARLVRRLTPSFMQSDWTKKQRGLVRKMLRRVGLSWVSSPVRRLSQAVCLVTFLILFFYVCWPYSARPNPAPLKADGWSLSNIDQDSGEFQLTLNTTQPDTVSASQTNWWVDTNENRIFLKSESELAQGDLIETSPLGEFLVLDADHDSIRIKPQEAITAEMLDEFLRIDETFVVYERDPNQWPSQYADNLAAKEKLPAEFFLTIDPLVSLSTAIASRSWVWSLVCAAAILIVCILIPRGFCGYVCPLGTTIDLFDWAIAGRFKRFRVPDNGWWVHIKYYLLSAILVSAIFGVLISGVFAAIPVITRAMLFIVDPFQSGTARGWHLVPPINWGHLISILLFFGVLGLGFLRPRFWCKYVCPSGAVFSVGNLFRATDRKVESSCINCNKCVEICPFDAIKPDFTTRGTDCTLCQSCAGVCPTHSIKFVERWNLVELKVENDPPTNETAIGRRGFLSLATGSAVAAIGGSAVAGVTKACGANLDNPNAFLPVRPPGSVPEQEFLQMCIRCGECFKACPNNVLQPEGFQQGLEGLWSPMVNANWAGCESSCNACGQVCPTGAIRALPMEEKRVARMGLAIVNETTCLPHAEKGACDLCVQECNAAGYNAIEFTLVGAETDESGQPIEGTGYIAPVVITDDCVGCGLCQTRCYAINVKEEHLLKESAIIVEAGEGKEDRLMTGSYLELKQEREATSTSTTTESSFFVPDAVDPNSTENKEPVDESNESDNPFLKPSSKESDDSDSNPFK